MGARNVRILYRRSRQVTLGESDAGHWRQNTPLRGVRSSDRQFGFLGTLHFQNAAGKVQ